MKKNFLRIIIATILLLCIVVPQVACSKEKPAEINVTVKQGKAIDYGKEIGTLASNNKSEYTIVYSENAGEAVKQAAKEIQNYVLESSDSFIKIADDTTVSFSDRAKIISLGETSVLSESGIKFDYSLLKDDGFFNEK